MKKEFSVPVDFIVMAESAQDAYDVVKIELENIGLKDTENSGVPLAKLSSKAVGFRIWFDSIEE